MGRGGTLRIGELAVRVGVTTKAIRHYEALGLLDPPRRAPNGYRVYPPSAVRQLEFVQRGKALGLTLDEIGRLREVARSGSSTALRRQVVTVLDEKLDEYERQLAELQARRDALRVRRQLAVVNLSAPSCACHGFGPGCGCLPAAAGGDAGEAPPAALV